MKSFPYIKLIAYSDIHHHEYTNGVTEADVVDIEHGIVELVESLEADVIIFGGDRFQSRNPTDYVKYSADKSFDELASLGKPIIALVGNHDRSTKNNESHHSLKSIELLGHKNVIIADKIEIHKLNIRGFTVEFYCIPAGHVPSMEAFGSERITRDENCYKICLFHDMLDGCLTAGGTMFAGNNELVKFLSYHQFDVAIGGDNHRGQVLYYSNSDNMVVYAGSPMQHTRNDAKWNSSGTVCSVGLSRVNSIEEADILSDTSLEGKYPTIWMCGRYQEKNVLHVNRRYLNGPRFESIECKINTVQDFLKMISSLKTQMFDNNKFDNIFLPEGQQGLYNQIPGLYREPTLATLENSILSLNIITDSEEFEGMVPVLEKKVRDLLSARQVNITIENSGIKVYEPAVANMDDSSLWAQFVKDRAYENADELIEIGLGYINDKSTKS